MEAMDFPSICNMYHMSVRESVDFTQRIEIHTESIYLVC